MTMYEVLCEGTADHRTLRLVKFNLPAMNRKRRKMILETVLDETGAMALIEFISQRGIIRTPKWDFYGILVFNSRQP